MPLRRDVALFPQGKTKAFTLSYDDGVIQDRRFIELLKKYKLQATFNLNSERFDSEEQYSHIRVGHCRVMKKEVRDLYAGFEVAGHTATHPDLAQLPMSTASWEVCLDKNNLEQITGKIVTGFAYPFGTWNHETLDVLKAAGIRYARTVKSTHNFRLPENFLLWDPCCHHDDPELMNLAEGYREIYEEAAAEGTLADLEVMREITEYFGRAGYAAVDINNQINMLNYEQAEEFCVKAQNGGSAGTQIVAVRDDGGFIHYDLTAEAGNIHVKLNTLQWADAEPYVSYSHEFDAYSWKYTDKGYLLIEEYRPPGYDGAPGQTGLRIRPLDEK